MGFAVAFITLPLNITTFVLKLKKIKIRIENTDFAV